MNILVPIGSAENTKNNLQYAIHLADQFKADLHLVSALHDLSTTVSHSRLSSFLKQEAKDQIEKIFSEVDKKGVNIVIHPVGKRALDSIKKINKQIPIDLMVLSPRTNSIKKDVYLGETSGKLLKRTNIPILVVPEGLEYSSPKTILMAFKNGVFEEDYPLEPVRLFSEFFGADIHVLHVHTPDASPSMKEVSENLKSLLSTYKETQAKTTFQGILNHFPEFDPDILCVVRRKRGFSRKCGRTMKSTKGNLIPINRFWYFLFKINLHLNGRFLPDFCL